MNKMAGILATLAVTTMVVEGGVLFTSAQPSIHIGLIGATAFFAFGSVAITQTKKVALALPVFAVMVAAGGATLGQYAVPAIVSIFR